MEKIRVLIADDSSLARAVIREVISSQQDMEVIGEAASGREAVDLTGKLKPDLITMDVTMPEMDGLEAIEHIMALSPTPILVITSADQADIAYRAVELGALEVCRKPSFSRDDHLDLAARIRYLAKIRVIRHLNRYVRPVSAGEDQAAHGRLELKDMAVGIAASTGGPKALSVLLRSMPPQLSPPLFISQHIGGGFSAGLSSWLDSTTDFTVSLAADGQVPLPGCVYIPPDGMHLLIRPDGRIAILPAVSGEPFIPSCNRMLTSLASCYKERSVGIVLTGMGSDGTEGLCAVRSAGGMTIAQDMLSSAVYGMPKAAVDAGCVIRELPLDEIASATIQHVTNFLRRQK